MNYTQSFISGARVANFSDHKITVDHVLDIETANPEACIGIIRSHADLPFVFLVSDEQIGLAEAVIKKLHDLRSPCFPYAVFLVGEKPFTQEYDLEVIPCRDTETGSLSSQINDYMAKRLYFDDTALKIENTSDLPEQTDVLIVGAGITGLYAAGQLVQHKKSVIVADKRDRIGGIWSLFANASSRVNSSEPSYRLKEKGPRTNRDHSATREILEDMADLATSLDQKIFLNTEIKKIEKTPQGYLSQMVKNGQNHTVQSNGIILAINDRVGDAREIEFSNQSAFKGKIVTGISDNTQGTDWKDKNVVIVGMGAFAIENARTSLENGARHVTLVCRRHGTVCPKIIDYLNFATPYDENFKHDNKSNFRNMMYWKKLYDLSGATKPECWMGNIKHPGHTISVSDIWFIGHFLKKIQTITGDITELTETGAIVNSSQNVEADIIVNCVGFKRNGTIASALCGYENMYNNNYVDREFMYLADAYIDDDAFNSFFGSSVLEMVKFYIAVYIKYFNHPDFKKMMQFEGIEKIPVADRKWSHYINGAKSLIEKDPDMYNAAKQQVEKRTANFLEKHTLEDYIRENKREWTDLHTMLAGRKLKEEEQLPYVFEKLL